MVGSHVHQQIPPGGREVKAGLRPETAALGEGFGRETGDGEAFLAPLRGAGYLDVYSGGIALGIAMPPAKVCHRFAVIIQGSDKALPSNGQGADSVGGTEISSVPGTLAPKLGGRIGQAAGLNAK
jgi:hypothetical protein